MSPPNPRLTAAERAPVSASGVFYKLGAPVKRTIMECASQFRMEISQETRRGGPPDLFAWFLPLMTVLPLPRDLATVVRAARHLPDAGVHQANPVGL